MTVKADTLLHLISDNTRLRCLMLLAPDEELCVCELTYALGTIQPKISRHLALLREAGVVCDRREGQWIYYRINPDLPAWAVTILAAAGEGVARAEPFITDRANLLRMPARPGIHCA